jgi:DNA polymerase delta subunit 1
MEISNAGHSVLAHIAHILPYFYVSVPRGFEVMDLQMLKDQLNNLTHPGAVISLELVKKRSLWGYRGDTKPLFLKIITCDPRTLPTVRGLFERGELNFRDLFTDPVITYESNIPYVLRFLIDTKVGAFRS